MRPLCYRDEWPPILPAGSILVNNLASKTCSFFGDKTHFHTFVMLCSRSQDGEIGCNNEVLQLPVVVFSMTLLYCGKAVNGAR